MIDTLEPLWSSDTLALLVGALIVWAALAWSARVHGDEDDLDG